MNSSNISSKKIKELKQISLKNKLENIKSIYILIELLNNLKEKKLLDLVKYNNN